MEIIANVYSELYSYLNVLDKELIERIPSNVYKKIYEEKNNEYAPVYNIEDFQNVNKMQKKTRIYIFYFHWKYWCDNYEERKELEQILEENEKNWIESTTPFKDSNVVETKKTSEIENTEKSLVVIKKKWYNKLFDWFKLNILKK